MSKDEITREDIANKTREMTNISFRKEQGIEVIVHESLKVSLMHL